MASRWLTLAGFLLACTLAIGVAQAQPTAQPSEATPDSGRVGISTSTVWLPAAEGYGYLKRAREAGMTWVREDFAWSVIEPERGRFVWRRTDALMRNAARLGMSVLAVAAWSPPWASGNDNDKYPPRRAADYARFVRAVVLRYGTRGTFWSLNRRLVPSPLTAVEIWNEPWHEHFWQPSPDPAAYARLVRAASSAAKAVRPRIKILASGDIFQFTAGGDIGADWLQPLLAADPSLWRSGLVDAWSVHTYCQRLSPWDTTAPMRVRFDRVELTRGLSVAAGAPLPIWLTELGWNTSPTRPDSVSEEIQALYEYEALRRATVEWGSFVTRSFIYTLNAPSREQDYNLLRPDGSPRPAWAAVQSFIASSG